MAENYMQHAHLIFSEWISPQVIANISLTLSRIIFEQQTVDQRLESFSRSSANRISAYSSALEKILEHFMNSHLRYVSYAIYALNASTQVSKVHWTRYICDCLYCHVMVMAN